MPHIGRIVQYMPDTGIPAPAIITQVTPAAIAGIVLTVFYPGITETGVEPIGQSVNATDAEVGHWWWPERK